MKIKMLDSEIHRLDGELTHFHCGKTYEIPADLAKVWIKIGIAKAVSTTRTPETETKKDG
jgi:hypothetical protein